MSIEGAPFVRAVFFDVGGTMVQPRLAIADVLREEARNEGVALDHRALAELPVLVDTRFRERASTGEPFSFPPGTSRAFWTSLYCDALDGVAPVQARPVIAARVFERLASPSAYQVYDDVLVTLVKLRAQGYLLGVISNWEAWLSTLLVQLGLLPWFPVVVGSAAVGIEKPDPQIFRIAAERSGLPPGSLLYVGDSYEIDVLGARAAGLRAVHLERPGSVAPRGRPDEDSPIPSLDHLPGLLGHRAGADGPEGGRR